MKRFKFRLQSVLDQRESLEKSAKMSFSEAQQALQRGEQLLSELNEVRAAILAEIAEQRRSPEFDPTEARLYQDYLQTITGCVREQEAFVRDLHCTAEAMRLNLVGASKNRKVVDKIKERDLFAHKEHVQRADQAATDEIATTRFKHPAHITESATS